MPQTYQQKVCKVHSLANVCFLIPAHQSIASYVHNEDHEKNHYGKLPHQRQKLNSPEQWLIWCTHSTHTYNQTRKLLVERSCEAARGGRSLLPGNRQRSAFRSKPTLGPASKETSQGLSAGSVRRRPGFEPGTMRPLSTNGSETKQSGT